MSRSGMPWHPAACRLPPCRLPPCQPPCLLTRWPPSGTVEASTCCECANVAGMRELWMQVLHACCLQGRSLQEKRLPTILCPLAASSWLSPSASSWHRQAAVLDRWATISSKQLVQCSHVPCCFLTCGLLHERVLHSSALCPSGLTAADQLGCGCLGDGIGRCAHIMGDRDSELACTSGQPAALMDHKALRACAASGLTTTACGGR